MDAQLGGHLCQLPSRNEYEEWRKQVFSNNQDISKNAIQCSETIEDEEAVVETLLIRLRHPDALRPLIIQKLGNLGNLKSVESIIALSRDSDETIRLSATQNMIKLALVCEKKKEAAKKRELIKPIIERLTDPIDNVKIATITGIGELEYKKATPALLNLLETEQNLAQPIANALLKLKTPKVKPQLLRLFREHPNLHPMLSPVIVAYGSQVVKDLTEMLKEADDPLFSSILAIAKDLQNKAFIEPIIVKLKSINNPPIQNQAIAVLRLIPGAASLLIKHFEKDIQNESLANALPSFPVESMQFLNKLLKTQDLEDQEVAFLKTIQEKILDNSLVALPKGDLKTRMEAAEVCRLYPQDRAAEHLAVALNDQEPEIRRAVAQALKVVKSSKNLEPILTRLRVEEDDETIIHLLQAVRLHIEARLPEDKILDIAIEVLAKFLRDSNEQIRIEVIETLSRFPQHKVDNVIEFIADRIDDSILSVKITAIQRLGELEESNIGIIRRLLRETDLDNPRIREAANQAIMQIHDKNLESLKLEEKSDSQLIKTLKILAEIGNPDALPQILEVAKLHPSVEVRVVAVKALGVVGNEQTIPFLQDLESSQGEENLRAAINESTSKINKTSASKLSKIDLLRNGSFEIKDAEILKIFRNAYDWFYLTENDKQLIREHLLHATEHYQVGRYSEFTTRLNNVCELLVMALYQASKEKLVRDETAFKKLLKKEKHLERLGALKGTILGPRLYGDLSLIHIRRRESDAAHGLGEPISPSDAILVLHAFRAAVFGIENQFSRLISEDQ